MRRAGAHRDPVLPSHRGTTTQTAQLFRAKPITSSLQPCLRDLRCHHRGRLRGLDQAPCPAQHNHIHRAERLGSHRSDLRAIGIPLGAITFRRSDVVVCLLITGCLSLTWNPCPISELGVASQLRRNRRRKRREDGRGHTLNRLVPACRAHHRVRISLKGHIKLAVAEK